MAGEIDEYAIVGMGDRWKPRFQFMLDILQGRLAVDELVHVLGWKLAALRADEHSIDGFGIHIRELQLRILGQVFVLGNADHQRVTARNLHGGCGRLRGRLFFEGQVAMLIRRRGLLRSGRWSGLGQQSRTGSERQSREE